MDDQHEPHHDDNSSSHFQRNVILKDWWLIKCSNEFEGKRFGVAGIEDCSDNTRRGALRVFTSSPIVKAFDVFTLQASDGLHITLQGFLNKERVVKCGFDPQISREFVFGFPPRWEKFCRSWFKGEECVEIEKGCDSVLSPCKNKKDNLEGSLAESVDRSSVTEKNVAEDNDKDGCSDVARAIDKRTVERKAIRLQSSSGGISLEGEREVERSQVQETTVGGDHGSDGLNDAMRDDVQKDGCKAIDKEKELDEIQVQNCTNDGAHGSEGLDKAKIVDVEKDKGEAIDDEVISPVDGSGKRHSVTDNIEKLTNKNPIRESLTSLQQIGKLKKHSVVKGSDNNSKCVKRGRGRPKKSEKTLKSDGNIVEPVNHSGIKDGSAENEQILGGSEVYNSTTEKDHGSEGLDKAKSIDVEKDGVISPVDECGKRHSGTDNVEKLTNKNPIRESLTSLQQNGKLKKHSVVKGSDNNSKCGKSGRGRPKNSSETLKSDRKVTEPINHTGSKSKEWGKTIRRIDFDAEVSPEKKAKKQKTVFDFEVTPEKEAKKQETNVESTGSVGQRRSRSGRVLVSSLDFWRNQVPVYDKARNIVQVKEGHETPPFKGKRSAYRKAKKMGSNK